MKILLRLLPLLALALLPLRAADEKLLAAVRAADDERVAATIAADRARLEAVFSDELRYAHSSGTVDTKTSYTESMTSGHLKYASIDYVERTFKSVAPGLVLMTGRGHFLAVNNGQTNDLLLSFLAVWREEGGKWRFLAWQSCKLPAPAK